MANQVDEVKRKTDIVELVGSYVTLKKAGRNYRANCPFHGEKTPSFMVSPELQIYKCFGCGESGDAFTFLQKYESMTFPESLRTLAEKAGVKLSKSSFAAYDDKQKLHDLLYWANEFYKFVLHKHPHGNRALSYLKKERGLTLELINTFEIGFCPNESFALKKFLIDKKGFNEQDIFNAGIIYNSSRGWTDRFRGRITFPLYNHIGKICGFAGRIMPEEKSNLAKYINSPETKIYSKSNMLYGLNLTKEHIKNNKQAYVVEGELDLISSWGAGIKNTVALKGSAFTKEQASLLARFTDKVVMTLDSDFAGDSAAQKSINVAEQAGLEVRVVLLGKYKDPDDFARTDPVGFKRVLGQTVGAWDFVISKISDNYDLNNASQKSKAAKELSLIVSNITDDVIRSHYTEFAANKIHIPSEIFMRLITKNKSPKLSNRKVPDELINKSRKEIIEEQILVNLLRVRPNTRRIYDFNPHNRLINKVYDLFLKFDKDKHFDLVKFSDHLPKEFRHKFNELFLEYPQENDPQDDLDDLFRELAKLELKEKSAEITSKIKAVEDSGNIKQLKKLQSEFDILAKKRREFEK